MQSYKNATFLAKIKDLYKMGKDRFDKVYYQVIKVIKLRNLYTIYVK